MILLDTHVLVWWSNGSGELSTAAASAISEAAERNEILVSAITFWEVALLVTKGRLVLSQGVEDWLSQIEALPVVRTVPISPRIALRSVLLPPPLHDDPADRILVATALALSVPLVTRDERLRRYDPVDTLW
ncbi:MAG TPA: type II toxin-antitoxin system VapC family toxin [Thermoanaerobaculia bacterium]|nr:type II toxin-antitoxin system VapC family toxin [Thermoanaerobaculia bacterium]